MRQRNEPLGSRWRLSDPRTVEDIRQAEADIATGNTTSASDLLEAMQARRPATT